MNSIFHRVSIRKYQDKEVDQEKIEKLLRAAMAAPSAQADNFCSAVFPAIDIQQESLDQRLAGTGSAGNHTEL